MITEYIPPEDKAVVKVDPNHIPDEIPILPLENQVAFPSLNMSLAVTSRDSSLVESAMNGNRLVGVVGIKYQTDEIPLPGQTYDTGTVVRVLYVTRAPDNTVLLVAHGLKRFRIAEWISGKNYLKARIKLTPETIESDIETDALYRNLRDLTQEIFSLSLDVPKEAVDELRRVKDKLYLTYIAAAHSEIDF